MEMSSKTQEETNVRLPGFYAQEKHPSNRRLQQKFPLSFHLILLSEKNYRDIKKISSFNCLSISVTCKGVSVTCKGVSVMRTGVSVMCTEVRLMRKEVSRQRKEAI